MIPFDKNNAWLYDDVTPTTPSQWSSSQAPTARNGYNDPTVAFTPTPPISDLPELNPFSSETFHQNSKASRRRFLRPVWIFALICILALGLGIFVNPIGMKTLMEHLLQPITHQSTTTIPPQQRHSPSQGTTQTSGQQQTKVTPLAQTLPPQWIASGQTVSSAGDAEVIAHGFVERYNSIEGSTPQSLATSLIQAQLFMTQNAQMRFQGKVAGVPPDPHLTPQFQQQFQMGTGNQKAIMSQQALADSFPQMQSPQMGANGTFFAIVTIPYQATVTLQNGAIQSTQQQMTVALVAIPKDGTSVPNTMGWAVSAFTMGTRLSSLPDQP